MEKSRDFARAFTLDNRTPIVLAVCHPKITEDVIEKLVIMMQIHPKDIVIHFLVNESLAESNAIQTQMLMAMEQVSRCTFQDYNHLGPIIRFCNLRKLKIRYQFFHFACRYNNLSLLKWLIGEVSLSNNEVANSKKMLNENDHAGYTPLLTAVFYEAINCVEYLLQVSCCF
jgi:ankyrin repeat protein